MLKSTHLRLSALRFLAAVLVASVLLPAAPWTTPPAVAQTAPLDPQAVYDQAVASVALIRATVNGRNGVGSGFFVGPDGFVLTAAHVARRADALLAEFPERGMYDARLVGYDARRDVALLRVNGTSQRGGLEVAAAGDVRVGEPVVVIGAPRGRPGVMTTGRVLSTEATLPGLAPGALIRISADAAPGSSGGPVLNARGQVIGLVIAVSGRPGAEATLAVSASSILDALPRLREGARVDRAWIGISGRTLTPEPGRSVAPAGERGALIQEVLPDSPAERAGILSGDVIVAFDGRVIEGWEELLRVVGEREPGQIVPLTLVRGRERIQVELVLGRRP